ncbi:MAG: hypothetical protein FWC41_13150, partial [Firmicutes bacterium]|nr:hypothetical protein [Bacillota bacterium]
NKIARFLKNNNLEYSSFRRREDCWDYIVVNHSNGSTIDFVNFVSDEDDIDYNKLRSWLLCCEIETKVFDNDLNTYLYGRVTIEGIRLIRTGGIVPAVKIVFDEGYEHLNDQLIIKGFKVSSLYYDGSKYTIIATNK